MEHTLGGFSHLMIAAVISMGFSFGLEFWYAWRKGKKEGKGMVETYVDMQNQSRGTREGFLHELTTGAVFLVTATVTEAIMDIEELTMGNILLDLGIAIVFAVGMFIWKKIF